MAEGSHAPDGGPGTEKNREKAQDELNSMGYLYRQRNVHKYFSKVPSPGGYIFLPLEPERKF